MQAHFPQANQPQAYFGEGIDQVILSLTASGTTVSANTPDAAIDTQVVERLQAESPTAEVFDITAALETKARIDLEGTAPGATTATSDASLQLGPNLTIVSPPAGNVNSGDLVSIVITGNPDSLSSPAGTIAIQSLDGQGNLTFLAPEPPLFGDQTETYNEAIPLTLTQGTETAEFDLVVEPATDELFGQIESIHSEGIYADDTLVVGDHSHFKNIVGDGTINVATGQVMVGTTAFSFDYAIYDGAWSGYATESFEAAPEFLSLDVNTTETVEVTAPNASLESATSLELEATTPATDATAADATLETSGRLELEATAPSIDVNDNGAALETTEGLALNATAPNVVADYIEAALETKESLELEGSAPAVEVESSDANIQTGSTEELNASTPEVTATAPAASFETLQELTLEATTPEASASGSNASIHTGNLDFIEPANTVLVEVAPMATVKHDGVNIPDWPAKDPDADIWNGLTLDFLADDDPVTSYSILINDQPVNNGDTIDGLTLIDSDSDLAKTITARLGAGTFGERYKVTTRYSTASIPSDDKSAYLRIINQ